MKQDSNVNCNIPNVLAPNLIVSPKKMINNPVVKNVKVANKNISLDSQIGAYKDSRVTGQVVRYVCPIGTVFKNRSCTKNYSSNFWGWKSISAFHKHMQEHCRKNQFMFIPAKYWNKYSKRFCTTCNIIVSKFKVKHKNHSFFLKFGSDLFFPMRTLMMNKRLMKKLMKKMMKRKFK